MDTIVLQKPEKIPAKVMYSIMAGGSSNQMKSLADRGEVIAEALVIAEGADKNGELVRYVVIKVDDDIYRTSSKSFMRGIDAFVKCFDPDAPFKFRVVIGRSASGREFITFDPTLEGGAD